METIIGRVWKYGDDVNTDVIFPGKYTYTISDPAEMVKHTLEDLDSRFAENMKPNDIIVAGKNWGCGSSREEIGVGAIIAKSFARIHYRNLLNAALPALKCPEAVTAIRNGEEVQVHLSAGEIRCEAGVFVFPPLPTVVMGIFEAGGLVAYTRKKLVERQS
jgi:3-isopropylmalate/(R)-2-methylmalate dehydratase small subunit